MKELTWHKTYMIGRIRSSNGRFEIQKRETHYNVRPRAFKVTEWILYDAIGNTASFTKQKDAKAEAQARLSR